MTHSRLRLVFASSCLLGLTSCLLSTSELDRFKSGGTDTAPGTQSGRTVTAVSITPDPMRVAETAVATVTLATADGSILSVDAAGDALTLEWHATDDAGQNDRVIATSSDLELSGTAVVRGESLYVIASIDDDAMTSSPVLVENSAPTQPVISLTPQVPSIEWDDLICAITSPSTDADGDDVSYTFLWTSPSGASVPGRVSDDGLSSGIPVQATIAGQWTCAVVASDGLDNAPEAQQSVMVDGVADWRVCPSVLTDQSAEIVLLGEASLEQLSKIRQVGDIDGDGRADIVVGANKNNDGGLESGKAYVFFGDRLPASSDRPVVLPGASADEMILGGRGDRMFYFSGMGPGDLDGDGLDDLYLGTYPLSGDRGYVVFGSTLADRTATEPISTPDVTLQGAIGGFGAFSAGGHDIDGDGTDDLLLGSQDYSGAGKAFIFRGTTIAAAPAAGLSQTAADLTFTGETSGDWFGHIVTQLPDVDGDGRAEVVIGARRDQNGRNQPARIYVYFTQGALLGPGATLSANDADIILEAESAGDEANTVMAVPDVDGDGSADLLVGAPDYGTNQGRVYLFRGADLLARSEAESVIGHEEAHYIWTGTEPQLRIGKIGQVNAIDLDGDGLADPIIAGSRNIGDTAAGKVYIFYSDRLSEEGSTGLETVDADLIISGRDNIGDGFANAVVPIGDTNLDGVEDIAVTTFAANRRGRVLIYRGCPPNAAQDRDGDGAAIVDDCDDADPTAQRGFSAFEFDGVDDTFFLMERENAFDISRDFTMTAWVRPDIQQAPYMVILDNERFDSNSTFADNVGLDFFIQDGQVGVSFGDGATHDMPYVGTASPVATGEWTHVAVTRAGTSLSIYINGVFTERIDVSSSIIDFSGASEREDDNILVGSNYKQRFDGTLNSTGYFDGAISELGIWNRALSETEVGATLDGLPTGDAANQLQGYWTSTLGTLDDETAQHGTGLGQGPEWVSDCVGWR